MGGHHPLYSSRTYVELMSTNPHCVLYLSRREGLGAMKKLLTCATERGEREQDSQTEREIQKKGKEGDRETAMAVVLRLARVH